MSNKNIAAVYVVINVVINVTALTLAFVWFGWGGLIVTFLAMWGVALNARLSSY
jgi:hypothetical protein